MGLSSPEKAMRKSKAASVSLSSPEKATRKSKAAFVSLSLLLL